MHPDERGKSEGGDQLPQKPSNDDEDVVHEDIDPYLR